MKDAESTQPGRSTRNLWAVVLAAGEGRRLASVTRFLYGREIPKQFAALDGERTLLQQTMDRLAPLVPPERTVVVVAGDRRELAEVQLARYQGVQIVSQPANVGTGPGVLLPLSVVKAQDPHTMVIVTPSDHHIPGQDAFLRALQEAIAAAEVRAPAGLVLMGAEATGPASDLGWIVPQLSAAADRTGEKPPFDLVESFVEKPPLAVAKELFRQGGLWNTLVVVGKVDSFWTQFQRRMPRQTALFQEHVLFHSEQASAVSQAGPLFLERLYRAMPPADFSRTILQNAVGLGVVQLRDSGWCDCGTPERLLTCLDDRTADKHPQLLQAILRSIQTEQGLQPVPVSQGG